MIELNKKYSTRQLAEALDISYSTLRNNRTNYEEHLSLFYHYEKDSQNRTTYYTFTTQLFEYIPYKEFKHLQRDKKITDCIKIVIKNDSRQTASNIARIIYEFPKEMENLQLSTLKIYVRAELKKLVISGYYLKSDYAWCYLDKQNNRYILMSPEEVKELRSYFNSKEVQEQEEIIFARMTEGDISEKEACAQAGVLRKNNFVQGLKAFQEKTGLWAMKVPLYKENALICDWKELVFKKKTLKTYAESKTQLWQKKLFLNRDSL